MNYSITLEDRNGDELTIIVDDSHPVWDHLHTIFEVRKEYHAMPDDGRKLFALGDCHTTMDDAEDAAICELVGNGFAPLYALS